MGQPVSPYLDVLLAGGQEPAGDIVQALMFIRAMVGCDLLFTSKVRGDANQREMLERMRRIVNKECAPSINLTSINEPSDLWARCSRTAYRSWLSRPKDLEELVNWA
jgi:hypothetical protein